MLLPFREKHHNKRYNTPSSSPQPPHLKGLDALRGLAILSVLLFHNYIIRPFHGPFWVRWVGQGAQGVGLFFILSALTLSLSWMYRSERDKAPVLAFWARRFWRIGPVFYLMLLITALFTKGNPTAVSPSTVGHILNWPNFFAHITFVFGWIPQYQNSWIGVEWSIGVEMTFYLLFPWIMRNVIPVLGAWGFFFTTLAVSVVWPFLLQSGHFIGYPWPQWAQFFLIWSFPTQVSWFGAGILLWSSPKPQTTWGFPLLIAWAALALSLSSMYWVPLRGNFAWIWPNILLVYMTWHDFKSIHWLSHNRILRYIGTRSYSIYLIHWVLLGSLIIQLIKPAQASSVHGFLWRVAFDLPLSLLLAELSYRYIERPGIQYGRRWINRYIEGRNRDTQTIPSHWAPKR